MLYKRTAFSVPATGKTIMPCDHATAMLDKWSRCIRCGEKIDRKITDERAIEYSKLRSSGLSVEEASKQVFGPLSPLAEDALEPLTLAQEPV